MSNESKKDLDQKIKDLEISNRKLREELEKKRELRKLQSKIEDLIQEQEDMQHEIETGRSREKSREKQYPIDTIIPDNFKRRNDIWL